jgi:ketosteroid isomerase-like protein
MSTDQEAIRNLLGKHAQLTDDGEVAQRVKLYVDDGAFQMGTRRSSGLAEIEAAFAANAANAKGGKHITSNMVIDLSNDEAHVQTDFAFFSTTDKGIVPAATGRYYDTLVKHDGVWLYRERRVVILTPPS